jgi:hypothetical protein
VTPRLIGGSEALGGIVARAPKTASIGPRLRTKRAPWAALATIVVATSLAGSTLAGASTGTTAPQSKFVLPASLKGSAPSSVNIGLSGGYSISFLPVLAAMGAGYFNTVAQRFHTTIQFDVYGSGTASEAAFLGGTDQWAVIGSSATQATTQGKDQVALMNEQMSLGLVFSAPAKYAQTRGQNISAYAGPTWCQIQPSGSSNYTALLLLAVNHIPLSSVNLTTIGSVAAVLPTIQSGQCSITSGDSNSAALGIIQNIAYVAYNTAQSASTVPLAGEILGTSGLTTSHAFISQYPKLAQAIVDAALQGLLFVQANASNPNTIYNILPSAMTATLSLGAFVQTMQLFGSAYTDPRYNNGEFPVQEINDTAYLFAATKTIASLSALNPSQAWSNKLVIQAYKDLNKTPVGGPATGPAKLPATVGKPSLEAANAYATLTGQPAPPNSGPAPMGQFTSGTTTTTTGATSTTS